MERLTGTDKVGAYLKMCRQEPCGDLKGNCRSCSHMQQALEGLAEYESLGITPEQVKEMDALFQKKCEEVSKLEEENVN